MAYPGRQGQHYQHAQGGGPPPQMPMPNYGPPPGQYGGGGYGGPPPPQQYGGYGGAPPPQQPYGGYGSPQQYQPAQMHQVPTGMQTMPNGMQFQYSNMRGKRKALLIGINYIGWVHRRMSGRVLLPKRWAHTRFPMSPSSSSQIARSSPRLHQRRQ